LNGTIGKELDLSQGSHLKLAGFKTLSQAVHCQEEEAGWGGFVLSHGCFSLSPELARVPPVATTNGSLMIHCSF